MKRLRLTRPPLAVLALLGVALLTFLVTSTGTMNDSTSSATDELPVVRAAVGMGLLEMRAASTYPFDVGGAVDDALFSVQEPAVLEYAPRDGGLAFRLPPTRFIGVTQRAGVVTSVTTTPQLRFAGFDDAYALAQQIADAVDATAWERVERRSFTEPELRRMFGGPDARETERRELAHWQAGDATAVLTLKRSYVAGSNRARAAGIEEDSYLVEVSVDDVELDVRLTEAMYARREAAGDRYEPLPLSVWLDEQD